MNTTLDLDEELSMESTSSKSDISKIDDYQISKKRAHKHFYKDYENLDTIYIEKKKNDKFEKCFKNNFKIEDNPSEFGIDGSISEKDKSDNESENDISFLGKKTKGKEINCNENEEYNNHKEKIFMIEKIEIDEKYIYRKDYYIMDFKGNFLNWALQEIQKLIDNCNFCKKYCKMNFHIANRELYGGNPKEEDNRAFITKTIEEVFTLTEDEKNILKKISRQVANEEMINTIKSFHEKLLIKKKKEKKDLIQLNSIEELISFFQLTIGQALEKYYDSYEFKKFKSRRKIQYYDKMFYSERNRGFSLLEKNNFIYYVNLPYYSDKRKA